MRVLWATLAVAAAWGGPAPDCNLVPGWQQKGEARSYAADNLFEYMDGNAEGYLIYGFAHLDGVTCTRRGDTILIDISEMTDADSAYGIFTANRHPAYQVAALGMGGQIQPRKAVFAKDRYYVELSASPEGDYSAVLGMFAAALEKKIAGNTALPEALAWFPAAKLVSLRLVPESVLGMRALKRGYAAEYEFGKAFLVREESAESAAAVMEKLRGRIAGTAPAKIADEAFQVTDRYLGRLCFFRKGRYLAGYANVAEGQDPAALAGAFAARLP